MEMIKRRLLFLTALVVLVLTPALTARADSVTLTGGGSASFQGYSAGPYSATLNGSPVLMICMSFDRQVTVGQTWDVTVNTLDSVGASKSMYFDQSTLAAQAASLLKYQRAAWLYDQLFANFSERGSIQGAIWNIFNPTITPDSLGSNNWLGEMGRPSDEAEQLARELAALEKDTVKREAGSVAVLFRAAVLTSF